MILVRKRERPVQVAAARLRHAQNERGHFTSPHLRAVIDVEDHNVRELARFFAGRVPVGKAER